MALERRASQPFVAPTLAVQEHPMYQPTPPESASHINPFKALIMALPEPIRVPLSQKAYLTLDEAVEYSGLPKAELLRMLRGCLLDGRKCGRWYVRRKSLEAL
jgi:hypothetical protein